MTVRELIKGSLRLLGVYSSGETPSASEQADALSVLNELIDSWSTDGLLIYSVTREEFAMTAGQASRTIGSGGNFSTTRPSKIIRVGVESNSIEIPVQIISAEEYAAISDKSSTSDVPQKVYIAGTYPLETLNLYPVPTTTNNLVIYSLKPISSFSAVGDSVSLPPGYQKALRFNLALELAPEYGREPSAIVVAGAQESLAELRRRNTEPTLMTSDVTGLIWGNTFNIYSGE